MKKKGRRRRKKTFTRLIPKLDTGFIVDSFLAVVGQTVADHELEVLFYLAHLLVLVGARLLPHCGQVHGVRHHVPVVQDLGRKKREIIYLLHTVINIFSNFINLN